MGPSLKRTYWIQLKNADHQIQLEILIIVAIVSSALEATSKYCASWVRNFNISYSEIFGTSSDLPKHVPSLLYRNKCYIGCWRVAVHLFICVIICLMLMSSLGCKLYEGRYHICYYHFILLSPGPRRIQENGIS